MSGINRPRPDEADESSEYPNGGETEETGCQDETALQTEEHPESVQELLLHNLALRRNFEHLKELHLDLTQANLQLRKTCAKLQSEKNEMNDEEFVTTRRGHDVVSDLLGVNENRMRSLEAEHQELRCKVDGIRLDNDNAMMGKHCGELEHGKVPAFRADNQVPPGFRDLASKCKHLEMDLQRACSVGEAAHEQLVTVTYEKDAVISELEQVIYQLQADLCTLEEKQENDQKAWEAEKQKLQATINKRERQVNQSQLMHQEEYQKQRHLCKSMEAEIADLHAMVRALEQVNSDVEARHAEAMKTALKESETLAEELRKNRNEHKLTSDSLHETQKRLAELQIEAERLRSELQTIHSENSRHQKDATEYRKSNDKLEHKLEKMNGKVDDLIHLREKDNLDHMHQLQELQSRWAAEKDNLVQKEVNVFKDKMDKLSRKNCSLKKKLKQSKKLLCLMTSDYNQLMVRLRECETQLTQARNV